MQNDALTSDASATLDSPQAARKSDRKVAARSRFDSAYFEWLAARAALANPVKDESDEGIRVLLDRESKATENLIRTPAPSLGDVLQKMEAVEAVISEDAQAGEPAYPFAIVGLAAIRADIIALGDLCAPESAGNGSTDA